MAWGDSFVSAWNSATRGARTAASALATGAKTVADGAAAAVQQMARESAKAIEAAAEWTFQAGKKIGRTVSDVVVATGKIAAESIASAYAAAKQAFADAVIGVATVICKVKEALFGDGSQLPFDGAVLGAGCQENSPSGVMPCLTPPKDLPKIVYVNGINTRYTPEEGKTDLFSGGICKTMQELARSTCSEVIGVYNATEGIATDLLECLENIAKLRNTPATISLRDMMVKAAREGSSMTLYAHSQGGLITQHAIAQAKQQLMNEDHLTEQQAEARLGAISVRSFGTAPGLGWPHGPHYERYTNLADPVPWVISAAQSLLPPLAFLDSAPADQSHVFIDPYLNPIDAHSMDDVYLPKLRELEGVPPHCLCRR